MELKQIALQTLKNCMAVKKSEEVVIVVDTPLKSIGEKFLEAAKELKSEAVLMEFLPRENNGEEPPPTVAGAMKNADVLMLITSRSLSHTQARHEACKAGARAASMPMVTEDMLTRTLALDYTRLKDRCDKYAARLSEGSEVHLTTPAGTALTFSITGRKGYSDSGILHEKGDFGNLPAGEAFVAPVEGSASGILVIDGSMAGIGLVDEPLKIKVKNGLAVEITGGESVAKLNAIVNKYGEKARNIAELGIGTNSRAKLTGFTLEDEKIAGSCHIALGDNSTIGGNVVVDSHLDGVLLKPTLVIDGKKVIDEGRLV